ncbi:MAG: beta-xylosidase [Chloroflexi bacterium]|nr:beta-xylosidase [Chloroflexota bacterium]
MITFSLDLSAPTTPFPHYWETVIGSGHAALGLRADWRQQLTWCQAELGFQYVRFHGLLCDDMSVYTQWSNFPPYSFFNVDSVFDFLLSIGMKPFVELSFMPRDMASGSQTIFHYQGNVTPPADYEAWAAMIRALVAHCVDRYGLDEVRTWFFEVWNEPNLAPGFWAGSQEDYFKLYHYTAEAIKSVDPGLRVGGPSTAKNAWIPDMIAYCQQHDVPLDFVSTHHYPTDTALGWDMDLKAQMGHAKRGVMQDMTQTARQEAGDLPLYYTEWNCSSSLRNPYQDESYLAAFVIKTIVDNGGLVDGYAYWVFSDLFEETPFPSLPFHGGFGLMTLHGVPKPVYRAYELLHGLGHERMPITVTGGTSETVEAVATRRADQIDILVYNHNVPLAPIETETVQIMLKNCAPIDSAAVRRIDADHANPKQRWIEVGQPQYIRADTVEQLLAASVMQMTPLTPHTTGPDLTFELAIPPHGVAAVQLNGVG